MVQGVYDFHGGYPSFCDAEDGRRAGLLVGATEVRIIGLNLRYTPRSGAFARFLISTVALVYSTRPPVSRSWFVHAAEAHGKP